MNEQQPNALLSVHELSVRYGVIQAVHGVSFNVKAGEIVTLIGANGSGKTSILRAISGLMKYSGQIFFDGKDITGLKPELIVAQGITHVPEGRGIFYNLTVKENLRLATWSRQDRQSFPLEYDRVFSLFPKLKNRLLQPAGTLSGGEQQMLAVGRALMTRGRLLILDEPSMGLSPLLVKEIFSILRELNAQGTTIFLVEQNARQALKIAHQGYVLENGRLVLYGTGEELLKNERLEAVYLGGTCQR